MDCRGVKIFQELLKIRIIIIIHIVIYTYFDNLIAATGGKDTTMYALVFTDYMTIILAELISVYLRNVIMAGSPLVMFVTWEYILLLPIPYICFMYIYDIYGQSMHFWNVIERLFKSCFFGMIIIILIQYARSNSQIISRLFVVLMAFFSFFALITARYIIKRQFRKLGIFQNKVLIVGDGNTAESVIKSLSQELFLSSNYIGIISDDYPKGTIINGITVLGGYAVTLDSIIDLKPDRVVIFPHNISEKCLSTIINEAQPKVKMISVIPDIPGLPVGNISVECLYDNKTLILKMKNNLNNIWPVCAKQTLDAILTIPIAVVALPVILVISIFVKNDSPGPALYTGLRVGKKGKLFKCYKFRSMFLNEKDILNEYLASNIDAQKEWDEYKKLRKEDPRVTKIGRLLRKTSLDELPQIINVLKGEMSLVGPRPYLPDEDLEEEGAVIQMVKPGMTGLWQTSGRNAVTFHERLLMESWYVRNWSIWVDIVILFRTVKVVLKGKGAY